MSAQLLLVCFFDSSLRLNSVKPHLPHVFLFLCSAINTPLPHLGHSRRPLMSLSPSTLYNLYIDTSPAADFSLLGNYFFPFPDAAFAPFARACLAFSLAAFSSSIIFFLSSFGRVLKILYRGSNDFA